MMTLILPKRALITGLTGQDGYYLARRLAAEGVLVQSGAREVELEMARAIAAELSLDEVFPCELEDPRSVEQMVASARPDVIYHLAAQSSPALSWREPVMTAGVNAMGTLYLLEALRNHAPRASFVMASSCDCFDHEAAGPGGVTPQAPFKATNPYAATKVMAHQLVRCYRAQFGLRLSVAVLFNHTSPRRPEIFVERGIVGQAVRVSLGLADAVTVGSLETRRDWSWAPEIMDAFAALGMLPKPQEMVLGSGHVMAIGDWVRETFAQLGLDESKHLRIDAGRLHPGDRSHTFGNIESARQILGWSPRTSLSEMVRQLIEHDLAKHKSQPPPIPATQVD